MHSTASPPKNLVGPTLFLVLQACMYIHCKPSSCGTAWHETNLFELDVAAHCGAHLREKLPGARANMIDAGEELESRRWGEEPGSLTVRNSCLCICVCASGTACHARSICIVRMPCSMSGQMTHVVPVYT